MERASQGCSRVRREIPSGLNQQWPETGRIALSSECSYRFVVCMSRVMASRSSRSGRGARCARGKRVLTHSSDRRHAETDAAAPNKTQGQNLGMGSYHGPLLTKRVGMSSRLGAGACSSSSVPRAAAGVLSELGRPIFSAKRSPLQQNTRGGQSRRARNPA